MGSLTEEQESILIGTLLGDGALRKKASTLLEINHSSKQKDYVFWLYSKFRDFINDSPKLRVNGPNRTSYRFTTRSIKTLNEFYKNFYTTKGHKTIPRKLKLNVLSLAIWFMDDGSKSRNAVYFNTQQFNLTEQEYLVSLLKQGFGLKATLNKDKKYYRIRLSCESTKVFSTLVSSYLLPSMRYKLP